MKKYNKLLSLLLGVILVVSGCSCKDKGNTKVSLLTGDMNATTYRELANEEALNSKITNKDNFLLYVYNKYCECSDSFKPIIDHVIESRNLIIYAIEDSNLSSNSTLFSLVGNTPALVLYKNGEISNKTTYESNKDYFNSYSGFESYLDKYTNAPLMYYINVSQLDEKIDSNETFTLLFDRSSCPFCAYLRTHYLKDYLNDNYSRGKFYAIEVDTEGIRFTNGEYNATQWVAFKNKYGLSNYTEEDVHYGSDYGFGIGYTPTMFYYENGEISDAFIQSNEKESIVNADGSTSYKITKSYYDDNPYLNETILASEYNDTLASFYKQKLYSFLDTHLSK